MENLTILCYPAVDTSGIERSTLILNCEKKALEHWLLIEQNRSEHFSPHLSVRWFKYYREDGHVKHYLTNCELAAKMCHDRVNEDERWRFASFRL